MWRKRSAYEHDPPKSADSKFYQKYIPVSVDHFPDYWYVYCLHMNCCCLFAHSVRRHPESDLVDPFDAASSPTRQEHEREQINGWSNTLRNFGTTFSDGGLQDFGYVDAFTDYRKRATDEYSIVSRFSGAPYVSYWHTPYGSGYSTDYASQSGTATSYLNVDGNGTIG